MSPPVTVWSPRPLDTDGDAYAVQTSAYKQMSGRERIDVMFRLNEVARRTTVAGIRSRHPGYTDEDVRLALFRLLFGDALTASVWPGRRLVAP